MVLFREGTDTAGEGCSMLLPYLHIGIFELGQRDTC